MGEMQNYKVISRIRHSGRVYVPGGEPIALTDVEATRLRKVGCIGEIVADEPTSALSSEETGADKKLAARAAKGA